MHFTALQKKIIDAFKSTDLARKFYLTGGTLLAVRYLGHRDSYDLDFFTGEPFTLAQVKKEIDTLVAVAKLKVTDVRHIADRWQWEVKKGSEHTKLELVWYNFKPLKRHLFWQGIMVDSLDDIAANKMMALMERHEPKDIFDIYHIIKKTHWSFSRLSGLLKNKFGVAIVPQTFFADAEIALKRLEAIRGMLLIKKAQNQDKILNDVRKYFHREARRFLHSQLR